MPDEPMTPPDSAGGWQVDVPVPESMPPTPEPTSAATPPAPARIVEALLFLGGAPLSLEKAQSSIRALTAAQFKAIVEELNQLYRRQNRPYAIHEQADGWVMTLKPRYRPVVDRLHGNLREARLSPAAIDVLSIVAYRQPATRQEIDSARGGDSSSLLRQLIRRGLISVSQREEGDKKEITYSTTQRFLELFGLSSLEDLPQTQDLQKI